MPRQNRVTPWGDIAVAVRGIRPWVTMGNRGHIHDANWQWRAALDAQGLGHLPIVVQGSPTAGDGARQVYGNSSFWTRPRH